MTARKPTTTRRKRPQGKTAKTIDLKAEDVTDLEKPDASADDVTDKADAQEAKPEQDVASEQGAEIVAADAGKEDSAASEIEASADAKAETPDHKASSEPDKTGEDATSDSANEPENETVSSDSVDDVADAEKGDKTAAADEKPAISTVPPVAPGQTAKKGGFGSGLFGGLLGGAAIVALSYVGLQQGLVKLPGDEAVQNTQAQQLEGLGSELATLKNQVAEFPKVDIAPFEARIGEIEKRISDVSEKIAAAGSSIKVPAQSEEASQENSEVAQPVDSNSPVGLQLEALTARLEGLKEQFAGMEGLNEQFLTAQAKIAELEAQAAQQAKVIEQKAAEQTAKLEADLKAAKDDILSSADRRINDVVTDLSNLGDQLGEDATALLGRVTSLEENNLSEKMQSSARTIALAGLESGVASGANYKLALTTFADVVGENEALTILSEHAETGAPTKNALAASFRPVYDAVLREAEDAGAATLIDRFLLNAQSLVKVRSLSGEKKGESLTNRLGVIEFHVGKGDLVKAAEEWDALPEAAKNSEAGAEWIKGLKARIAVDAAMSDIRSEFGNNAG